MSDRPTTVEVGQRWQLSCTYTVMSPKDLPGWWSCRAESGRVGSDVDLFYRHILDDGKFLGYAGAPSSTPGRAAMAEHVGNAWYGTPRPAGCLKCGAAIASDRVITTDNFVYLCDPCGMGRAAFEFNPLWKAWQAGARDFPRTPAPGLVPEDAGTQATGVRVGQRRRWTNETGTPFVITAVEEGYARYQYDGKATSGTREASYIAAESTLLDASPAPEADPWLKKVQEFVADKVANLPTKRWEVVARVPVAPKPTRREVSNNGRLWVDYDRVQEQGTFESWPYRRWQVSASYFSVAPEEPRGYHGKTFAEHVRTDVDQAAGMAALDESNRLYAERLRTEAPGEAPSVPQRSTCLTGGQGVWRLR